MAKRIVTLYIDDTSLRLMVTKGKRIKHWVEAPLDAGLIKNSVVIEEAEVAERIKHLFEIEKIKTKRIAIGISGLHCLSRPITLPRLPKAMLTEAVMREAKRELPIPPEQLYISWQTMPTPGDETKIFLVAIPRKTADTLIKVLHQAKLKPYVLDIKPLLLTRLAKKETAIIIDVQATEFDIVIVSDSIPQPIRTISFPRDALSLEEKLPLIKGDLDRTIKFFNSTNQDKPLTPSVPIFVSGELGDETDRHQPLSEELGHPVLPLSPAFESPLSLDTGRYMVNIGLVLQEFPSPNGNGTVPINLNALPAHYRPKSPSLMKILALPSAIIATALIALIVTILQSAFANNSLIRGQLNDTNLLLQQKTTERQTLIASITGLEGNISELEALSNSVIKALDNLENRKNKLNSNLPPIIETLPSTVSLNTIGYANNTLTVTGKSKDEQEVLSYLRGLEMNKKMGKITITNMTKAQDTGVDFTFTVNLGE